MPPCGVERGEARRGEARRSAHGGERGHDGCDCTGVQERLEEEARAPEGGGMGARGGGAVRGGGSAGRKGAGSRGSLGDRTEPLV